MVWKRHLTTTDWAHLSITASQEADGSQNNMHLLSLMCMAPGCRLGRLLLRSLKSVNFSFLFFSFFMAWITIIVRVLELHTNYCHNVMIWCRFRAQKLNPNSNSPGQQKAVAPYGMNIHHYGQQGMNKDCNQAVEILHVIYEYMQA